MNSYGVRCIFDCPKEEFNTLGYLYEERITVWKADDIDLALDRAIDEAKSYANTNRFTYSGLAQAFWMISPIDVDGVEVFSLLRESDLELDHYLSSFFSNGHERQKTDVPDAEDGEQDASGNRR
jgi:hypothetical protein